MRRFRCTNNFFLDRSAASFRFCSNAASSYFFSTTPAARTTTTSASLHHHIDFSSYYHRAEQDLQLPIARLLLSRKIDSASSSSPLSLVTSAVLATPSSCSCGDVCTCPPLLKFTGVNSALHRQVHHNQNQNQNSNNSSFVIKGLLKGCAEQNALGAFAASGNNFEQIRGIVICSLVLNTNSSSSVENNNNSTSCCFPCTACRNYLSKVYGFVAARHSKQVLKLSCISLKLDTTIDSTSEGGGDLSEQQKKMKKQQQQTVSLDCMNGWNTSFREEVLRF